ncbi:hypothetical protein GCM10009613_61340 [Pseudonocardia kongjuensis]|uniref:Secreted protein n=1 Tax=Pseudonocardia kongjuensis TaxID=102227 RepID=A0ABN1Y9Z8_9PSEU
MRSLTAVPLAALIVTAAACTSGVAGAQDDPPPVSAVQLCAATDIDQVDALLARVADTQLVQDLQPLASLTVPREPDGVTLAAGVDLDQVRTALDCTTQATPTPVPLPATETPAPTAPAPITSTAPGGATTSAPPPSGFDQLDQFPVGAAETGGGPA